MPFIPAAELLGIQNNNFQVASCGELRFKINIFHHK